MIEIILRDYEKCPQCGSTSVEYDPLQKRHRCLERQCGWMEETPCLPLRSSLTGRPLTNETLLIMIREKLKELRWAWVGVRAG